VTSTQVTESTEWKIPFQQCLCPWRYYL